MISTNCCVIFIVYYILKHIAGIIRVFMFYCSIKMALVDCLALKTLKGKLKKKKINESQWVVHCCLDTSAIQNNFVFQMTWGWINYEMVKYPFNKKERRTQNDYK